MGLIYERNANELMMKNDVNIIKKKTIAILPQKGILPDEQLADCLFQLGVKLEKLNLSKNNVLKQHIFLKEENKEKFLRKKKLFQDVLDRFYAGNSPPASIIAQAPADALEAAMEVTLAEDSDSKIKIENKSVENLHYKVIPKGDYKEVFACGLTSPDLSLGVGEQAEIAFSKMQTILDEEKLDFSAVIRQWNYIEEILKRTKNNCKLQQNYQIFNDIRSKYYKKAAFPHGYPAATGIGMDTGGVVIDFIAASENEDISVKSIKNPQQVDAHNYSKSLLVGEKDDNKTTPKFERAKAVSGRYSGEIYISGTAAIRGEKTIKGDGIIPQVITTIENIKELLTSKNLKENDVKQYNNQVIISSLRVYVKNKQDISKTSELCGQFFPEIPALYLVADICRDNLLVEIEGKAQF